MDRDILMAKNIATRVKEHGGSTYYVGGFVRDLMLNKPNKDIDIEVHGITPDVLKQILSEFGQIKTQGASFGVYNIKGYNIDIAQPRMETAVGRGHKDFEVTVDPFIGTEKAAIRRDFTINALMKDVLTGDIIDHFNGLNDLHNGIIRHVNDTSFVEDPLRVLRAAQFAARFNFKIANETLNIMKTMNLDTLSKERIYGEMQKALLKAEKPSVFFEILRSINQLNTWFPELKELIDCKQNEKFHPEGDVWTHTMLVLDKAAEIKNQTSNPEFFMVSALCHDLGKPKSIMIDNNGVSHSYNHENIGIDITREFLGRLNNDVNLTNYVLDMVKNHMVLHKVFDSKSKAKSTNAKFDRSICPKDLILLTLADSFSKNDELYITENNWLNERFAIYEKQMTKPEVTGKDLIDLGLKPGPLFSEILKNAHKQHLSFVEKDKVLKGIKTMYVKGD